MNSTNEEKRVEFYRNDHEPTKANDVTENTPLDVLNLNWREKDLPQYKRTKHVHSLHPYLGKFIPQLAEIFLRKYFSSGQTVYDPFVGSGTTLVQANELNIHSIGSDISAFNVMLCRAKTAKYDPVLVKKEVADVLAKIAAKTQNRFNDLPLFRDTEQAYSVNIDNEWLQHWYAPRALHELIIYRDTVLSGDYQHKDLLLIILSRAARSARLTTHYDLDFPKVPQTEPYHCYKHSRICTPVDEAFKFLKRYSEDTVRRIAAFDKIRTDARVQVEHADSRFIALPPINGIVTSPPYIGLIDYHEQHIYAYHLLNLEDKREKEIGSAEKGVSKKAHSDYKDEIVRVFENALRYMASGSPMIIVAADKYDLYLDIVRALDVSVEGIVKRHVNRRTGRRANEFYETIFIWRKN